ncbi:hypothetical protein O6H91_23G012600 [Diphasiastrum complanatum]|uniref:Uncharacterized protein n=1 Tax=Diphasiastrum complanatum TaxID=34168 RepID=A0ACC2AA05_DIPCM|nr:hypothetical protein O6H91_23G012600 [Diphasiastrum complanatum]
MRGKLCSKHSFQALSDALTKQKEQELAVEGERHGYKKAIHLEQEKADMKTIMLKKIDGQKKLIQKDIEQIVMKRSVELEKYGKLLLSCEEIERSQATTKSEQEAVQNEILIAEKEILKHSQSISKLETEMLQGLSEHITLERSTQHLVEGMMELRQRIRSEEMTATELEYELARIRVDSVAVEDYVRSIKDTLNSLDGEVKQKNSYISKMQLETRRKNSEIEVKTKEIDRLNKQYDKLTANLVDKNVTPWENIIVNIRYKISIKAKVSGELQKQWLVLQTDLVCLTNENMNLMEKVQTMESEKLTLIQRKKRLETDLCAVTKYSKDLDNSVRIKHSIITRLNEMIAKNSSMREYLASENLNLRSSHTLALKNLKEETLKLECQKEECNTEKLDVSREIVELQRHVVLWKRKITYEKKTQDALMEAIYSPSALLGSVKKEQGRLKLKLEDLTSRKERLVMDMETRVSSRQAIVIRVKAMSQKKPQEGPDSVEAVLLKGVTDLRRAVRECERAGKGVDERLETLDSKRELLASRIGEIDLEITMVLTEQEQVR